MMPGVPAMEDYDSPIYDKFWETAIELGLQHGKQKRFGPPPAELFADTDS